MFYTLFLGLCAMYICRYFLMLRASELFRDLCFASVGKLPDEDAEALVESYREFGDSFANAVFLELGLWTSSSVVREYVTRAGLSYEKYAAQLNN